jgi:diguanylate cyclase (GGDEF)-like protein
MSSSVGLAIQCVGILLVALLSMSMRGSIKSASLKFWTRAWLSLSIALMSLFAGFHIAPGHALFYSVYFFGEYVFGLMFIGGCRYLASGASMTNRCYALLIPAALLALTLPWLSADFNDLFMVQAAVMSALFAVSFIALWPALRYRETSPGLRIMAMALVLLMIDFLHYLPVFGARKGLWGMTVPAGYLQYTSIFDLILEILLGFGTIMVLLEGVRNEVEATNRQLTKAHDKLELMARMDPLTEALNRHAFHSLMSHDAASSNSAVDGCVAVIDIDNLKPINDTLGHSVGDKAIRAVARAVRSLIRADDMVFRWGGDEFLVLMFKLHEEEASRRMKSLNRILEENGEQWTGTPVRITVSSGVCGFDSLKDLGPAIEAADQAMYGSRQQTRSVIKGTGAFTEPAVSFPQRANPEFLASV